MKKIEIKFYKIFNAIIAGILTLLGFTTSCKPMVEYGTPSAKFIVNGKVTSRISGQPINNIRVIMERDTIPVPVDSAYTDQDGNYQVIDHYGFPMDQTYQIKFSDIDSTENGEFEALDTVAKFIDPEFTGGHNWYSGETSTEVDVKLESAK